MIILASQSPRRSELLRKIVPEFAVFPADIDEKAVTYSTPEMAPEAIAAAKAAKVIANHPNDMIIACDTIVLLDGRIIGKPSDEKSAYEILRCLSGRTHKVISGYVIRKLDKTLSRSVTTEVTFNKLDDDIIHRYIKTGSPFDKAGAYGIQDQEFNLVSHIDGSYYNVMGLPIESLEKDLRRF